MKPLLITELLLASVSLSLIVNAIEPIAWYSAGVLLMFMLILSTIDLLMEYYSYTSTLAPLFSWKKEILDRAFVIVLVPISLMADVAVYLLAGVLPHEFLVLGRGWLFFSITTLIWLNTAYIVKVLEHIRVRSGGEHIPPTLIVLTKHIKTFIRSMRMIDEKRHRESGRDGMPPKRWVDQLDEEQLARIAVILNERPGEAPKNPTDLLEGK